MSAREVMVRLTPAEASALARLAECAGNTYDDALAVLDAPSSVRAGYRAIDKLRAAINRSDR